MPLRKLKRLTIQSVVEYVKKWSSYTLLMRIASATTALEKCLADF